MHDYRAFQTRFAQIRMSLLAKVPMDAGYLCYAKLYIDVEPDLVSYRAVASLWVSGSEGTEVFKAYFIGESAENVIAQLEAAAAAFEIWSPEAIAATLGLSEGAL